MLPLDESVSMPVLDELTLVTITQVAAAVIPQIDKVYSAKNKTTTHGLNRQWVVLFRIRPPLIIHSLIVAQD